MPDDAFSALADRRRRDLLAMLARGGPRSATALARDLPVTRQAVVKHLGALESWKAIRAWLDSLVQFQRAGGARGGCAIGSLVGQLAETDEPARQLLTDGFARWEDPLRRGLVSMQERGKLDRSADPDRLATATLAAIQGGLVLTQSRRDPDQLAIAVDAAYAHLRSHAAIAGGKR